MIRDCRNCVYDIPHADYCEAQKDRGQAMATSYCTSFIADPNAIAAEKHEREEAKIAKKEIVLNDQKARFHKWVESITFGKNEGIKWLDIWMASAEANLIGSKVFVLSVMNEEDEFQVESVHATEAGAEARKVKISQENGFDKEDEERYFFIETKVINN